VLLDRTLGDADAELEQFTANPLGTPERVIARHPLDQGDRALRDARTRPALL